jgi:hypothetical protein
MGGDARNYGTRFYAGAVMSCRRSVWLLLFLAGSGCGPQRKSDALCPTGSDLSSPSGLAPHDGGPTDSGQDLGVASDLGAPGSDLSAPASPDMADNALLALYVDGHAQHVNHGPFWLPGDTTLTNSICWEAWAQGAPWDGSTYIISDGYGGEHALLWSGTSGNIAFVDGSGTHHILSFASDSAPPPNVFSNVRVELNTDDNGNTWIVNYVNGIVVGTTPVPAGWTRTTGGVGGGTGTLYVGGSDHSNFTGYIAQLRGQERQSCQGAALWLAPDRVFNDWANGNPVDFFASYMGTPEQVIWPDLSRGYSANGGAVAPHSGYASAGPDTYSGSSPNYTLPVPKLVSSPSTTAPFYSGFQGTPPDRGYKPLMPVGFADGAKLYDSFSRPDQTFAHTNIPTLGNVEYSTLGTQPWQALYVNGNLPASPAPFQLFDRSVRVGDLYALVGYANSDSGDMEVGVTHVPIGSAGNNFGMHGLAFRIDAAATTGFTVTYNFLPGSDTGTIIVSRWDGPGIYSYIALYSVGAATWGTLRAIATGATISIFTDSTLVGTLTDTHYADQTGAGFYLDSSSTAEGIQSVYVK